MSIIFKKIKDKLNEEYLRNKNEIFEKKYDIDFLMFHTFEEKIKFGLFSFLYVYMFIIGLEEFTDIIPDFIFPVVVIGGSLTASVFRTKFLGMANYFKWDDIGEKKLGTQIGNLDKVMELEFEIEKLNNRNEVIQNVCNLLDNEHVVLKRNLDDSMICDLNEKNVYIQRLIDSKNSELDFLSAKSLWLNYKENFFKDNVILIGLMIGLVGSFLLNFPIYMIAEKIVLNSILVGSLTLGTFFGGFLGTMGYFYKREEKRTAFFDKLSMNFNGKIINEQDNCKGVSDALLSVIQELSDLEVQLYRNKALITSYSQEEMMFDTLVVRNMDVVCELDFQKRLVKKR